MAKPKQGWHYHRWERRDITIQRTVQRRVCLDCGESQTKLSGRWTSDITGRSAFKRPA